MSERFVCVLTWRCINIVTSLCAVLRDRLLHCTCMLSLRFVNGSIKTALPFLAFVRSRYAAFYWARELVFTRNKLIVFTTLRELSHYDVFS